MSKNADAPKPLNVVFCDDVRREVSGKDILIGAYGGDIVVRSVPAVIPIALWIQLDFSGTKVEVSHARVRVTDPSGRRVGEATIAMRTADIAEHPRVAIILPPLPINIAAPGLIKILWASEGNKFDLVAEKEVIVGQTTTVRQHPSEQSSVVPPS